ILHNKRPASVIAHDNYNRGFDRDNNPARRRPTAVKRSCLGALSAPRVKTVFMALTIRAMERKDALTIDGSIDLNSISTDGGLTQTLESLAAEIGGVRALVVGDRAGLPIVSTFRPDLAHDDRDGDPRAVRRDESHLGPEPPRTR